LALNYHGIGFFSAEFPGMMISSTSRFPPHCSSLTSLNQLLSYPFTNQPGRRDAM
jgi:hypothetical protein